jgi:L-iditol 2-dehydrogenase
MKALLLTAESTLEYTEVPEPLLGPGELRIDIKACGICGSDIHGMDGCSGRRIPPIIMGHEAAGVISELGEGVENWKIGDRVTFDSTEYCGHCRECREGNFNLCENRRVLGVSCQEYRRQGCFAEQVVVSERILHPLPDSLDFGMAAFAEPVAIALHAVNLAPPVMDKPAIVVGVGLIGLLVVQVLKARGWKEVIAVDLDDKRLAMAKHLGATQIFSAQEVDLAMQLREMCGGDGAGVAFEVVGTAETVDLAVRSICKGGTLVLLGNLQQSVPMPLQEIVTRQLTLRGSCACSGEYPEAIRRIEDGSVQVKPLLSVLAPLEDGAEWFARLTHNTEGLLKVILVP